MIIARQSTARTVTVGPVLDADGVAVTGGVVGDLKISKNGGAPAALNGSAVLTHRHTGFYSLALTASDLDTVGQAEVVIDDTVNAMPMKELTVIEEAVYDALFAASAAGYQVPIWSSATATVSLTNTTVATVTTTTTATNLTNLPTIPANWLTAAGTASDFGTEVATAVWASGTRTLTSLSGLTVDTVTTLTNLPAITANWLTAAGTAADFGTEVGTAVWATAARTLTAATNITDTGGPVNVDGSGNVSVYHLEPAALAEFATEDTTAVGGDIIAGSVAYLCGWAAWDQAKADHAIPDTFGDYLDDEVSSVGGGTPPSAAAIADAVWDEVMADHLTGGSTGASLNGAGSAGDPWTTALPGAYGAGTAGFIVGTNLNATVSSRSSHDAAAVVTALGTGSTLTALATAASVTTLQTGVDAVPTNAELATALAGGVALIDGAITEAKIATPAEASGRPTGILGMIRRLFEGRHNKRTRNRTTGVTVIRNAADTAALETATQSTASNTDTQTAGA